VGLLRPGAAEYLHLALQDTTLKKPESYGNSALGLNGVAFLGEENLKEVKSRLTTICPGCVVTLYQYVSEVIHVPHGWVHQVVNLQPCLKVACNVYDPLHYHAYALTAETIASPFFGNVMAEDYMAVNAVVEGILNNWGLVLPFLKS
jgi:hypothetical protein